MKSYNKLFAAVTLLAASAPALAEDAAAQQNPIMTIVMLVGFVAIFYFMLWRPQSKRAKEHKNLMGGLKKGDEVRTAGGILGRVTKVSEENAYVTLEVSDNFEIKFEKSSIAATLPKGTLKSI